MQPATEREKIHFLLFRLSFYEQNEQAKPEPYRV